MKTKRTIERKRIKATEIVGTPEQQPEARLFNPDFDITADDRVAIVAQLEVASTDAWLEIASRATFFMPDALKRYLDAPVRGAAMPASTGDARWERAMQNLGSHEYQKFDLLEQEYLMNALANAAIVARELDMLLNADSQKLYLMFQSIKGRWTHGVPELEHVAQHRLYWPDRKEDLKEFQAIKQTELDDLLELQREGRWNMFFSDAERFLLAFPEEAGKIVLKPEEWEQARQYLDKNRELGNWDTFCHVAFTMQLLSAKRISIPERGTIEMEPREPELPTGPTLPKRPAVD